MDNPTPPAPASTAWSAATAVAAGAAVEAAAGAGAVVVAGASGLVGREILAALLADESLPAVHTLGRRTLAQTDARLIQHIVDFAQLPPLPAAQTAYIALGTTIRVAGSQAAFRAVDHDAVLAVARAARAAGVTRLGVVSAMSADVNSRLFYNRVKGETERELALLGFDTLVIARPSVLAGDRHALGQPERAGEALALKASTWLRPLIPPNYRAIAARKVATALIRAVRQAQPGVRVILSGELQRLGTS